MSDRTQFHNRLFEVMLLIHLQLLLRQQQRPKHGLSDQRIKSASLDIRRLNGYEHLDILWGKNVHVDVIPQVVRALRQHCEKPDTIRNDGDVFGPKTTLHPDAVYGGGFPVDGWDNGATSDYATSTDA